VREYTFLLDSMITLSGGAKIISSKTPSSCRKSPRGYPFPLELTMSLNYAFDSFPLLEGFLEATWLLEKHHLLVGSQRRGILSP